MSNRHQYEEEAIEKVIAHLNRTEGRDYRKLQEHVLSGRKNCDYLLSTTDGRHKVAVELVRLFDDPASMERHRKRIGLWRALREECADRGISGFIIRTPDRFDEPLRELTGRLAKTIAAEASTILEAEPTRSVFTVNGFEFKSANDFAGVGFTANVHFHWVDKEGVAARHFEKVVGKDSQVAIPDARHIIAAVPIETALDPREIAWEFASREDVNRLLHADQVVVVSGAEVTTVYSRKVRDYLDGASSFPTDEVLFADLSLQARLAANAPGAFELVRAFREEGRSLQSLSVACRRQLAHHGDHLVNACRRVEASWIALELLADPDPEPDNAEDSIVTVRGAVAFLIEKIVASSRAEEVTLWIPAVKQLTSDSHCGVRGAAVHPLNVLLAWRDELRDGQPALNSETRREVKRIWLDFLETSLKAGDGERAAQSLSRIQHDLSEDEVERLVIAMRGRELGEGLEPFVCFLVYFAFLRSSDPGLPQPFDDSRLRSLAKGIIRDGADFAATFAFLTRNSARDTPAIRRVLGPLLIMLLEAPQDGRGLRWTLETATFLARDGLLSVAEGEAICAAVQFARPAPEFRAWLLADVVKELAEAIERTPSGLTRHALLASVSDPFMATHLAMTPQD